MMVSLLGKGSVFFSLCTFFSKGLWGYNGLLSMAAVSCVFFPLTPSSLGADLVNMAATVFVQRALARNMDTVLRNLLLD